LHADGAVRTEAPTADGTRAYVYDPRRPSPTIGGQNLPPLTHGPKDVSRLERRDDVLVYATDALARPLRARGELELVLTIACDRVDTDLHVRLCDTAPDGKTYLVGETLQRAKLRDGRAVQLLVPDEPVELRLRFPPHAYTWASGHRLKLIVTGGNAPRYEPNTHTGRDDWNEAEALVATVALHHGAARGSWLVVPQVE
jgi:putative CocE/NonD family hydrolase